MTRLMKDLALLIMLRERVCKPCPQVAQQISCALQVVRGNQIAVSGRGGMVDSL